MNELPITYLTTSLDTGKRQMETEQGQWLNNFFLNKGGGNTILYPVKKRAGKRLVWAAEKLQTLVIHVNKGYYKQC